MLAALTPGLAKGANGKHRKGNMLNQNNRPYVSTYAGGAAGWMKKKRRGTDWVRETESSRVIE